MPGLEGLSPAIELMRKAADQAADEAMEGQFVPFLEGCLSGAGSPGNGCYERKDLAAVGEINVRAPRDRLSLFEERAMGRHWRWAGGQGAEIGASAPRGCRPRG